MKVVNMDLNIDDQYLLSMEEGTGKAKIAKKNEAVITSLLTLLFSKEGQFTQSPELYLDMDVIMGNSESVVDTMLNEKKGIIDSIMGELYPNIGVEVTFSRVVEADLRYVKTEILINYPSEDPVAFSINISKGNKIT